MRPPRCDFNNPSNTGNFGINGTFGKVAAPAATETARFANLAAQRRFVFNGVLWPGGYANG